MILTVYLVIVAAWVVEISGFMKATRWGTDDLVETRDITIKQGRLRGLVYEPSRNGHLNSVEVYLGLPYAAPPIGSQRFMPPMSPPSWPGLRKAHHFGSVCPQKLPDISGKKVSRERRNYLERLMDFIKPQYQSEDCLYLNIYAPIQEGNMRIVAKYPVIVFIHGESFEWNSGNAYNGTVLASYGNVIVVTFNFRLGILGFLGPVVNQDAIGNFGLLDQLAALQWVHENIAAFGGDPKRVTLMGHGTGAACANYLLVSPVTEQVKGLFHRAILMSGTALSDWAITRSPLDFTIQVSQALNCPNTEHLLTCLRSKRLTDIMNVTVHSSQFVTPFGPVVDGKTVPNEPKQLMGVYNDLFSRYELMYGVTQLESLPLLDPVALHVGQDKTERNKVLRDYLQEVYTIQPDAALAYTLQAYTSDWGKHMEPIQHRNLMLDILTDARVASPIIQTGNYHCKANPRSYFYVFTHQNKCGYYKETSLERSVSGDELAYVFGLPIDGGEKKIHDFTEDEELLAEALVTYWTNFATTGNPNKPHRLSFLRQSYRDSINFDVSWPDYDQVNQTYIALGIPTKIGRHYRAQEMEFWNKILPETLDDLIARPYPSVRPTPMPRRPSMTFPAYSPTKYPPKPMYHDTETPPKKIITPSTKEFGDIYLGSPPNDVSEKSPSNLADSSSVALTIVIVIGVCFLLVNLCAFAGLYYQRDKLKLQEELMKRKYEDLGLSTIDDKTCIKNKSETHEREGIKKGAKIKKKTLDSGVGGVDDDYEAIRSAGKTLESGQLGRVVIGSSKRGDDMVIRGVGTGGVGAGASGSGMKKWALSRQCSASTMDPNTKVREWIAHEIVQRCSPSCMRRPKPPTLQMQASTSINTSIDQLSHHGEPPQSHSSKPTTLQRSKTQKVSVAVDATPAARCASLQKQLSSEQHMSKSMDELGTCVSTSTITLKKPSLKRSATTVEDLANPVLRPHSNSRSQSPREITRRSTTNISLQVYPPLIQMHNSNNNNNNNNETLNIDHQHSRSDPTTSSFVPFTDTRPHIVNIPLDVKSTPNINTKLYPVAVHSRPPLKKSISTSETSEDINVTSRDSGDDMIKDYQNVHPLKNIQRRKFPKVLPDFFPEDDIDAEDIRELSPVQSANVKRRSLPLNSHLIAGMLPSVHEGGMVLQPTSPSINYPPLQTQLSFTKVPPPPPPRVSSTLGRKPTNTSHIASPEQIYPRPEPRVIIKPTSTNPVTRKAPIKTTKNNQPIPRVTPNDPDIIYQQRQMNPGTIPKMIPNSPSVTKTLQIKPQQQKLVVPSSKISSNSLSTSSEADDGSSNTGTVKRVKRPTAQKQVQPKVSVSEQSKDSGTEKQTKPPKNWYTKYNKSFLSKSKEKE